MTREEVKAMLPVLQAFAEGKTIESRCVKGDKSLWYDDEDPSFDDDFEYRIKPESEYRPFANAEECWTEMLKHQPFGWVKLKATRKYFICKAIGDFFAVVGLNDRPTNYDELFEEYIFADGTPFGVKLEE
nr:MAG TPA: hypothetical protein [Caudoviricetes sp.]